MVDLFNNSDIVELGQFTLVDQELFNSFAEGRLDCPEDVNYNYCPDCRIPMSLSNNEYQCVACNRIQDNTCDSVKDHNESVNNNIKISTGAHKGRFYNISSDYPRIQRKSIETLLFYNNTTFTGRPIAKDILVKAAAGYNEIQQLIVEKEVDPKSGTVNQKKFVRRGGIKAEVLAGYVYFECIRAKASRKKKDIAAFMKLPTNGFSRGEDILRTLHAEGKIDIPIDKETTEDFVDRYLETLNLENEDYKNFIIDMVELSEQRKIGMHSHISSKIVGTIWILICQHKLGISAATLERAADNTKKNTFVKFQNIVQKSIQVFAPIYQKYKVPLNKPQTSASYV